MNDPRHDLAMDLFLRACELPDTAREAFLDQACIDDDTLCSDVTSLLKHHRAQTLIAENHRLDVKTRMLGRERTHRLRIDWNRELGRLPFSFWLSVFLGIAVLVLAVWTRNRIHVSLKNGLRQDLNTVLQADVRAVKYWVARQKLEVKSWSRHPDLSPLAKQLEEISKSLPASSRGEALLQAPASRRLLELLRPVHDERPDIVGVIVFDVNGICLIHTIKTMVGVQMAESADPYLARIRKGETVLIKPALFATFDPAVFGPVMGVAAPIRDERNSIIGGLAFAFPSDDEYTQILSIAQIGETGETYAFDRDYTLLSNPRHPELLVAKGWLEEAAEPALTVPIRVPSGNELPTDSQPPTWIAEMAVKQGQGINLDGYRNYLGDRVVGVSQWLDDLDFGVCTEIAYDEAFAPVKYVDRFSSILLGLTLLFAVATSFYTFLHVRLLQAMGAARRLGSYTLGEMIGQGGMGKVYLAQHALLRRPTAIKVLDGQSADRETVARFEREVQLTSQLTHPNTIQIYDFGRTDDDVFYFAMEYVLGPTLSRLVELAGPLPPARAVHILLQACESLKEAHDLGLIHRDVKPANMMLCKRGGLFDVVKVLDFGLVKSFLFQDAEVTQAGTVSGTPAYVAPERLGKQKIDHRSDIFSLGAVAYFLLTGQDAFHGATPHLTLDQVLHAEPTPPSGLVDTEIPDELEQLVMRCLAKSVEERPSDLGVVILELFALSEKANWRQHDARVWWDAWCADADESPAGSFQDGEAGLSKMCHSRISKA